MSAKFILYWMQSYFDEMRFERGEKVGCEKVGMVIGREKERSSTRQMYK